MTQRRTTSAETAARFLAMRARRFDCDPRAARRAAARLLEPRRPPMVAAAPVGEHRIVAMASGGTLTLSASVSFMKLAKVDRDFVFGLIDRLDAYEAGGGS